MKTFETEKGNIPEGATHYMNQTSYAYFAWGKFVGENLYLMLASESEWTSVSAGMFDDLKPIPQTKEVEWVNGDACRYANDIEHEYTYVGEHPHGDGHYAFSEEKGITYIANGYLLEPETEAERKEREELEASYDLYCDFYQDHNPLHKTIESFECSRDKDLWLRTVRKTNYKVKGE